MNYWLKHLKREESLEDLFEQRKQQRKNHQDKQQRRAHKPSNVRNIIVKFDDLEQVIDYAYIIIKTLMNLKIYYI